MNKLRSIYASAYSATMTILVVVVVTIGAELAAPFKTWLANFTGHHWVTKSWLSLIAFAFFYGFFFFIKKSVSDTQTRRALVGLQVATVVGFAAILGFFIYEFLAH